MQFIWICRSLPGYEIYHWIEAHIHAYSFFGGVTRILVPDNLKTGVIKNTRTELVINRSYHEMAEHYGTAIIPTRFHRPFTVASDRTWNRDSI